MMRQHIYQHRLVALRRRRIRLGRAIATSALREWASGIGRLILAALVVLVPASLYRNFGWVDLLACIALFGIYKMFWLIAGALQSIFGGMDHKTQRMMDLRRATRAKERHLLALIDEPWTSRFVNAEIGRAHV